MCFFSNNKPSPIENKNKTGAMGYMGLSTKNASPKLWQIESGK
jgi:hypothetical protein